MIRMTVDCAVNHAGIVKFANKCVNDAGEPEVHGNNETSEQEFTIDFDELEERVSMSLGEGDAGFTWTVDGAELLRMMGMFKEEET